MQYDCEGLDTLHAPVVNIGQNGNVTNIVLAPSSGLNTSQILDGQRQENCGHSLRTISVGIGSVVLSKYIQMPLNTKHTRSH